MEILLYGALLIAQAANSAKQYAMKNCAKCAPGPFNSVCINLVRALICLVVSVIIWLSTGGGITNALGHAIIIISGVGTAFNLLTWILSSRLVSLALIEALCMIGSLVVPLILAPVLYNGETVSLVQWIGCAMIFVSVFLFMNKESGEKKSGSLVSKIVTLSVCVISVTVASVGKKYYTFHITANGLGSVEYFTMLGFATVVPIFLSLFALFYALEKRRIAKTADEGEPIRIELPYKKTWIYILIAGIALYVNELFTSYASELPSAIFYPLSRGLIMLCAFLLDVIVFKDKVTVKKLIGLVVVIAAMILVNL